MPDGDHITLARMGYARPGVPHLLVVHGLEAVLGAKYAHGLLGHARDLGWSGDLLLFRSCDGELNSAPRLYHSGETSDLDFIVRRLKAASPESPLFICGVSLGGNVLVKWLGELGDTAPAVVSRAAAVSVPFDLAAGSRHLEHGFARVYVRHFLKTLRAKALAKAEQFPGLLDAVRVAKARTFWEFDDAATAPLHGFADAADYYARSSSMGFISRVRVPTLVFSALDDPIVPRGVTNAAGAIASTNGSILFEATERGGHVGWVEGAGFPSRYYMEERVVAFFDIQQLID